MSIEPTSRTQRNRLLRRRTPDRGILDKADMDAYENRIQKSIHAILVVR